ncbi:MAG: hypothetical protein AAF547_05440 [Actinomycetota bacterium]
MSGTRPMVHPEPAGGGRFDDQPGQQGQAGDAETGAVGTRSGERLIRLLTVLMALLTVATVAVTVWALSLQRSGADERARADEAVAALERRLDETTEELAAARSEVELGQEQLAESEDAMAAVRSSLDGARDDLQSLEQQFPVDLGDLSGVSPEGSFDISADLVDCIGWTDCSEENWEEKAQSMSISCSGGSCTVDGLDSDGVDFEYQRGDRAWSAVSSFGATCSGEDSNARWILELQPTGLTIDGGALTVQQFSGRLRYEARPDAANCRDGDVNIDLTVVRR